MGYKPAAGFFFEIGASSSRVKESVRSQKLEQRGWTGICAVPFPGDFSSRACRIVAMPVSGSSGKEVSVSDCTRPSRPLTRMMNAFGKQQTEEEECPQVEANTLGIVDLLSLSAAPPVIDYIALDTEGSEIEILKNFPFNDFCVRSWIVKHNNVNADMAQIRDILEVPHGCRIREGVGEYFVRCVCQKKAENNPLESRAEKGVVDKVNIIVTGSSAEAMVKA
jgi:hypothetical protein